MRLNRSDRLILLVLMVVVLAVWAGVLLDRLLLQPRSELVRLDEVEMDSLEASWSGEDSASFRGNYYAVPVQQPETFPFDPNEADSTALLRLGLAPWQVRAIYKYRARGGRYHSPEDFKRLPGMTPELWNRLASSIHIGEAYRYYDHKALKGNAASSQASGYQGTSAGEGIQKGVSGGESQEGVVERSQETAYSHQEKFTELTLLDLNSVDTTTLKRVPGIASYRARLIVRYRNRLGGYTSVEQLSEIENLPIELQAWFKVENGVFRKLNLNTASIGELARHPYVGSARAKAIANYRRSQGRIQSLSDLALLPEFSQDVIQRLEPYVEY